MCKICNWGLISNYFLQTILYAKKFNLENILLNWCWRGFCFFLCNFKANKYLEPIEIKVMMNLQMQKLPFQMKIWLTKNGMVTYSWYLDETHHRCLWLEHESLQLYKWEFSQCASFPVWNVECLLFHCHLVTKSPGCPLQLFPLKSQFFQFSIYLYNKTANHYLQKVNSSWKENKI